MHLFDGVNYFLSTSLPEDRVNELSHVLDRNGAHRVESIDDASLTHFITNSNSFERWQNVTTRQESGNLVVVTDNWVDKSLLLGKLQQPSFYSADPAMIFSGVVACAAELEPTDLEVLSAGITALGGQWRTGLTKDVTHLFVTKSTSQKYSTALHYRDDTRVKIILPHWFDDAVRLGISGLETTPYEWPDPPILRIHGGEGAEGTKADAMKRAALRKVDSEKKTLYKTAGLLFPGAPLPSRYEATSQSSAESPRGKTRNVWEGRRVLLGRSLELSGSRRDAVDSEIIRAGGKITWYEGGKDEEVAAIDECDVFVTRYRSGKAYVQAVRQTKTIGTLPWVFHVHSTGTLSPPMDQLLWYPIPRRHIEGFSGHEITVTNYTGESREYIKKLIVAMGAVFTPSMSGKNTVLIAAYISGTKTTKAASWSIPIVNHLWLEDCFVKWRNLTVALEKYIVFPPGIDFSRQLGNRGVGREVEEIGEDELELLEHEEDELVVNEGDGLIYGAEIGKTTKDENGYPTGTPGSAKDAQEVEEAIGADGDVNHTEVEHPELGVEVEQEEGADTAKNKEKDDHIEGEEETLAPSRPAPTPKSTKSLAERLQDKGESAAKTRIKPRPKGKPKPPPAERSSTPQIRVLKRKSSSQEAVSIEKSSQPIAGRSTSSESEDEVEVVEPTTKKAKKKLVRRAGERSESWIMDAVVVTPLRPVRVAQEEEEEEEVVPRKQTRGVLKKSPSKQVLSEEDSDEEHVVLRKDKKTTKRNLFIDNEVEEIDDSKRNKKIRSDEEDEEDEPATSRRRKRPVVSSSTSRKGKEKLLSQESESDKSDDIVIVPSKLKSKAKGSKLEPTGKGKKTLEPPGSEQDKEPSRPPKKTSLKSRASYSSTVLRVNMPLTSDEEEELVVSKIRPRASTSKLNNAPTLPASDEDNRPSTSKSAARSRLPTFKSQKAATPPTSDEDDLTPPPLSPAKKATKTAIAKTSQITKIAKKRSLTSEDDDDEPSRPPNKKTAKSRGHHEAANTLSSNTPKRTVSVLLPGLTLSTKKSPERKGNASTSLPRTESIRVAADERASTSRSITVTTSKSKPKAKPAPPSKPASPSPARTVDEENTSILVSGRLKRGAAARATQKLHEEIMPDVMNYQQEMRNVGKGMRSLGSLPIASGKKRQSTEAASDAEDIDARDLKRQRLSGTEVKKKGKTSDNEEDEEEPPSSVKTKGKKPDINGENGAAAKVGKAKKPETDDLNSSVDSKPGAVRVMTTQVSLSDDVVKALGKLGVRITIKPSECTHLLAPHLVRTEKFLCALAKAPFILTAKWATESAAAKKLLNERDYLLRDKTNEKKFAFVLADAVSRAKELRGTLFSKMVFYITPRVSVDIKLLKNVVTACGGQVNTQPPTLRIMNANADRYIISCPEDMAIWRPIAAAHPVYTHELILTSALKQEIDWDNEKYRVPNSH